MPTTHAANIEAIKAEILAQLNCDPKHPPVQFDEKSAATALGVQANTLSVWRSNVSVRPTHLPNLSIKGDGVRVFLSGRDSPYRRDFHAPTKLLP